MADSDVEINVDDVCDSMAADHGVEVQTIIQGQVPIAHHPDDLDFMVQEEVETTTDGDTLTVELDPVDNVIIALQNTDSLTPGGHFDEHFQDGGDIEKLLEEQAGPSRMLIAEGRKRKSTNKAKGSATPKKKTKRSKKQTVRFANRQIPGALATASLAKEAKEANEASFDPHKRPRRWKKRKVPVKTLDGQFTVSMWSTGTYVWVNFFVAKRLILKWYSAFHCNTLYVECIINGPLNNNN